MSRRNARGRPKQSAEPVANDSDDSSDERVDAPPSPPRRVSSRSTKFKDSMKEKSDSIADLIAPGDPKSLSSATAAAAASGRKKQRAGGSVGSDGSGGDKDDSGGGGGDADADADVDAGDYAAGEPSKRAARSRQAQRGGKKAEKSPPPLPKGQKVQKEKEPKQPKSPAIRHKSKRHVVKTEVQVSSDLSASDAEKTESEEEDEDEDEGEGDEGEEEDELKIQRIIASRSETRRKWREICSKMNTSEIDNGSRWFQDDDGEKIRNDDTFEERFLVKWSDLSYMHCSWELEEDLIEQIENAKSYLTLYFRRSANGLLFSADERGDGEYYDPSFVQIERIMAITDDTLAEEGQSKKKSEGQHKKKGAGKKDGNDKGVNDEGGCGGDGGNQVASEMPAVEKYGIIFDKNHPDYDEGTGRQFLVKWGNSPYSESSYEFERDLILNEVDYEDHVRDFLERRKKPTRAEMLKASKVHEEQTRRLYKIFGDNMTITDEDREKRVKEYQKKLEEHEFPNGGLLRDYQAEGVSWMVSNYVNQRSSILADEMGLGKTIQTAVFVNYLATVLSSRGPYLVVAPLSTLQHWYREFSSWTHLNTIIYHGSAKDREHIREFEFAFEQDRPRNISFNSSFLRRCHKKTSAKWEKTWMVTVVVTTPEMLVTDDFSELTAVEWELLVVDEAHRLKNHSSKLAVNLRHEKFRFKSTLLLTGTPIQNNMTEMWTLLNIVAPGRFGNASSFLERYGDIKSKEKLDELHEKIRPFILRRLKEDVEKSVPPKEETLIEVELTVLQKQYYRALYERNVQFLHRNKKKALDGPSINNLAMQLRKCCNHPFLLRGVEEEVRAQDNGSTSEGDFIVKASGKLVLLDKLLPKLRDGGHRVLIFSQFKIMLDILEDYLVLRNFKAERIDGSITGKKRQMAIDRFQVKNSTSFVMLLSTRAGGVGINLTAADTCIIFDSDWNPQNDLQAQARCHRIGQTKSVKVYRLLSRKTYEMQMFHMSSLKMGLDHAVLQGIEAGGGENGEGALTKEEVENLLRHGAYDIFNEEKSGVSEKESKDFIEQDIDSILERRAKTVVHENTGSKSSSAGGTFSKASFKASQKSGDAATSTEEVDIDDPDFWKKMVGEARVEDPSDLAGKKRKRKEANYSEKEYERRLNASLQESGKYPSSSDEDNDEAAFDDDASATSDDDIDFDVAGKDDLNNEILRKLRDERNKKKRGRERSRWGGAGVADWRRADAEAILKTLMTYGYGNIPWDDFVKKVDLEREEPYEIEEIKRMSWSISLSLLREAADDEVRELARRAERAAERKRGAEEGSGDGEPSDGALQAVTSLKPEEDPDKELSLAFKRLWTAHSCWAKVAVEDALAFSSGRAPRTHDVIDTALGLGNASKEKKATPLAKAFNENVWPALRSRGWKDEETPDGRKKFSFGGRQYRSVSAVLDAAPKIHSELSNTIESIIASVAATIGADVSSNSSGDNKLIDPNNMTPEGLTYFLQSYAPLQLLVDRKKANKVTAHARRFLGVLSFMDLVHDLVKQADGDQHGSRRTGREKVLQLEKLLTTDKRMALPHPAWKPRHDAVLISAIAKHGWIDRERVCHAIAQDSTIKFGPPFDEGSEQSLEEMGDQSSNLTENISFREMKRVAERAAAFLNSEGSILPELKGFNKDFVVSSYGLVQSVISDGPDTFWEVNDKLLNEIIESGGKAQATGVASEQQYLPSKKDLSKRAKLVLSRVSTTLGPVQVGEDIGPNDESPATVKHDFYVLDQSNRCNIFLAELLHATLKVSVTKGNSQACLRKLLHYALKEVDQKMLSLKSVEATEKSGKRVSVSMELSDMKKLHENLRLIGRTIRVLHKQAKNVIRCILGIEPLALKNDGSLFPNERYNALPSKASSAAASASEHVPVDQSKESKKVQQKQKESAAGDIAINRALAMVMQKGRKKPTHSEEDSPEEFLKLTSIETLILSVVCSQGLPVWTEDWESLVDPQLCAKSDAREGEEFVINWFRMGGVVLNAATVWQDGASKNLAQKLVYLEQNRDCLPPDQVKELSHECQRLQQDLDRKFVAIADARHLRADPQQLARKTIMMLESLNRFMGPVESKAPGGLKKIKDNSRQEDGLGPRVVQWCCKELNRWANCLNIVDENGKCFSSTASDYMDDSSETNLAAFFDKKACHSIFIQVAQQTRLRSIFIKNGKAEVASLLPKALRNLRKVGNGWNKCPPWWSSEKEIVDVAACKDDIGLLVGLLDFGYSGFDVMLRQNSSFRARIEKELKTNDTTDGGISPSKSVLTRASAQQRANNLTRELSSIEDTADVMRLVSERANRKLVAHDLASPEKDEAGSKRQPSIQTGIDNFFKSSQVGGKKVGSTSKVSDTESVGSIEIIEVDNENGSQEKRKREDGAIAADLHSKKSKA